MCMHLKFHFSFNFEIILCPPIFPTGQRLFQRSGAGSDSFSETSSVDQVEETLKEDRTSQSSNIQPPTSLLVPEEISHTTSDVVPQVDSQVEAGMSSEEKQPEGQDVEHCGR